MDMMAVAARGLGAVLAANPDVFRQPYRRAHLYNDVTHAVTCAIDGTSSWRHGITVYEHLQSVRARSGQAVEASCAKLDA